MQLTHVLIAFLLAAAITCNKNDNLLDEGKGLTFSYAATQCADPWQHSADDNIMAQHVKQYLTSQGIATTGVSVKRTSDGAACLACTCTSGKTVYVTIANDESTKAKLKQLGFQ